MTHNQIEFQKLLESQRHNMAQEALGAQQVTLGEAELRERQRSNLAVEGITADRDAATRVHYLNQDTYASNALAESIRHNMVSEDDAYNIAYDKMRTDITGRLVGKTGGEIYGLGYLGANQQGSNPYSYLPRGTTSGGGRPSSTSTSEGSLSPWLNVLGSSIGGSSKVVGSIVAPDLSRLSDATLSAYRPEHTDIRSRR